MREKTDRLQIIVADDACGHPDRGSLVEDLKRELGIALKVYCSVADVRFDCVNAWEDAALKLADESVAYDAAIVDILWPPLDDPEIPVELHEPRGLELIDIAKRNVNQPVVIGISQGLRPNQDYGKRAIDAGADAFQYWGEVSEIGGWKTLALQICPQADGVAPAAISGIGQSRHIDRGKTVFVAHGRSAVWNEASAFLESLGLAALEFAEAKKITQRHHGRNQVYVGEILDVAFEQAQAVLVVLTPDDEARLKEEFRGRGDSGTELELSGQARPNVIFEAGMAVGRHPSRVILLECGDLRPISDLSGLHQLRMDNSEASRQQLFSELEQAGCDLNLQAKELWKGAGDFSKCE